MEKINCWDFMQCGRQPGGSRAHEGVCPVPIERKLHGVHGGINAGRACWVVAHTLCHEKLQESFVKKYDKCTTCSFYKRVKEEEANDFQLSAGLYMMLH